jgi:phosphate-selective porin OprO/OprP
MAYESNKPICLMFYLCLLSMPSSVIAEYEWPGFDLTSTNYSANIKLRAQLRVTSTKPYEASFDDADEIREKEINRARVKIGGKLGAKWIDYYTEYDFPSDRLLDLRITFHSTNKTRNLRVGQWKVPFNRERIDSSGKQQFVDRSIANKWFTLDRQRGIAFFGRLATGTRADNSYHLAILEGTGRNGEGAAKSPMWLGRWDWNFLGREVGFSQSDTSKRREPAGSVSVGASDYQGPYTAFSSAGGGQLPGYGAGSKERYKIRQYMLESAFQYTGFSWQQEFHHKVIDDTQNNTTRKIQGGYLQAGYFLNSYFRWAPPALEVAVRYASVDPDLDTSNDRQTEIGLVLNWFFRGHDSKLSLGVDRFWDDAIASDNFKHTVVRLQWDFHI